MTRILKKISRITAGIMVVLFSFNMLYMPVSYAQVSFLPAAGTMVPMTGKYNPVVIKGMQLYPNNPFKFDFIVDTGDTNLSQGELKEEGQKLIGYFLASLTTPEKEMWVNLSPYEKDRIIPKTFGDTQMGKALLSQDYLLKQIMATALYPERQLGREFWQKVYSEARAKFGTTDVPVSTFNKVWILPDKAVVYENSRTNSVFVVESSLKVMLEKDYLAMKKNMVATPDTIGTKVIREVVIPALQKEVNEGKNFAPLRQVYQSLILAAWYKKNLRDNVIARAYVDRNKIKGVDVADKNVAQEIYKQYLQAYRKGVYNFIKEDIDPASQNMIPRKYFSGGMTFLQVDDAMTSVDRATAEKMGFGSGKNWVEMIAGADPAMTSPASNAAESKGAVNNKDEDLFYQLRFLTYMTALREAGKQGEDAVAKARLHAYIDTVLKFGIKDGQVEFIFSDIQRLRELYNEDALEREYSENMTPTVVAAVQLLNDSPKDILKVMQYLAAYHVEIARLIREKGRTVPPSPLAEKFAAVFRNDLSIEDVLVQIRSVLPNTKVDAGQVEKALGNEEAILPVDPAELEKATLPIERVYAFRRQLVDLLMVANNVDFYEDHEPNRQLRELMREGILSHLMAIDGQVVAMPADQFDTSPFAGEDLQNNLDHIKVLLEDLLANPSFLRQPPGLELQVAVAELAAVAVSGEKTIEARLAEAQRSFIAAQEAYDHQQSPSTFEALVKQQSSYIDILEQAEAAVTAEEFQVLRDGHVKPMLESARGHLLGLYDEENAAEKKMRANRKAYREIFIPERNGITKEDAIIKSQRIAAVKADIEAYNIKKAQREEYAPLVPRLEALDKNESTGEMNLLAVERSFENASLQIKNIKELIQKIRNDPQSIGRYNAFAKTRQIPYTYEVYMERLNNLVANVEARAEETARVVIKTQGSAEAQTKFDSFKRLVGGLQTLEALLQENLLTDHPVVEASNVPRDILKTLEAAISAPLPVQPQVLHFHIPGGVVKIPPMTVKPPAPSVQPQPIPSEEVKDTTNVVPLKQVNNVSVSEKTRVVKTSHPWRQAADLLTNGLYGLAAASVIAAVILISNLPAPVNISNSITKGDRLPVAHSSIGSASAQELQQPPNIDEHGRTIVKVETIRPPAAGTQRVDAQGRIIVTTVPVIPLASQKVVVANAPNTDNLFVPLSEAQKVHTTTIAYNAAGQPQVQATVVQPVASVVKAVPHRTIVKVRTRPAVAHTVGGNREMIQVHGDDIFEPFFVNLRVSLAKMQGNMVYSIKQGRGHHTSMVPYTISDATHPGYIVIVNGVAQPQHTMTRDRAMVNGGIDLGKVNVNTQGNGIRTAFSDPAQLKMLLNAGGLVPVIYRIQPVTVPMMSMLLGFNVNGTASGKPRSMPSAA